jgi:hypothetical protein
VKQWLSLCCLQYRIEWSPDSSFPAASTFSTITSGFAATLTGTVPDQDTYIRVAAVPPSYPTVTLPSGMMFPFVWSAAGGCPCAGLASGSCHVVVHVATAYQSRYAVLGECVSSVVTLHSGF